VTTTDDRIEDLESANSELRDRLRRVEDVQEIIALFARWHYACTGGFDGLQAGRMEALDCLTDDATIEAKGLHDPGKGPKGRDQCLEYWSYYYGDAGPLPYVFQTNLGDRVEVDGDTAIHYNDMLCITQPRLGVQRNVYGDGGHDDDDPSADLDQPFMLITHRKNYLLRTPDGWRIQRTTVDGGYRTPLQDLIGIPTKNELPAPEPRAPWKP
jgi:hypothetical protein